MAKILPYFTKILPYLTKILPYFPKIPPYLVKIPQNLLKIPPHLHQNVTTKKLKILQNSKSKNVTKHKNSKCDKTQNVTKLRM